jgi:hypothetical protein
LLNGTYPRLNKVWKVVVPEASPPPAAAPPPAQPALPESCVICTEALDDPAYVFPLECCQKSIHCGCVINWLAQPEFALTCPFCRRSARGVKRRATCQLWLADPALAASVSL